ncbi:MAG TPA: energy-coupling factor ABC transporter permease [Candidatus Sulfotelmatobacter sp.]|nr:energy-coupling factor ABC transporter permease [Candidatus Sulfotelmatobacter sp.]
MHILDGYIDPTTAILMLIVSGAILVWSWKKVKADYPQSFVALLAVSSAFIFAAQMINFPIMPGTSGHIVGATFLGILLGPYAGILSMTIILLMQAFFFADGGLLAFGANVFNMAIIGVSSFFIIKLLTRSSKSSKRFASSIFVASWLSVVLASLAAALEMGASSAYASAGGITFTIPMMLFYYGLTGLAEGAITTTLVMSLRQLQPAIMSSLSIMKGR